MEELMRLFALARQTSNNKNASSVLGNLDNPMLAFLAGAYVPPVDAGIGSMPLNEKYSSMDDPLIQEIMALIDAGADEYEISSALDNLIGGENAYRLNDSMWQAGDLKSLAVGLVKERKDAAAKTGDSWWQKAGLSDPSAQYDETNVPLSPKLTKKMSALLPEVQQYAATAAEAKILSDTATKEYEAKKKQRKEAKETPKYRTSDLIRSGAFAPENRKKSQALINKSLGIGGSAKDAEDELKKAQLKYFAAKQKEMEAEFNARGAESVATGYARGAARAAREQGRTPTRDQLASIMRFLTSQG